MAWQYLTPVLYSSSMVEDQLVNHPVLLCIWNLNPTTPIINAYRQILYYREVPDLRTLLSAIILGITISLVGFISFGRLQKGFAEEL